MALAARLLPGLLFSQHLSGGAARLRTPGAAKVRPLLTGLCCFCRRRLGSGVAPFPRGAWTEAASARSAGSSSCRLLSPPGFPAALASFLVHPRRSYSTEEQQPQPRQKTKMIILGVSNPVNWIRTRIYSFLIWAYFDQEFSIREFSEGAKQAFAHVSKLLSQCKFDLLEELVAKELKLRRKFVNILMCFWYLTSANIPSETLSGASVFQVKLGDQNVETKKLLSASYE
ncbi:m-AAA protease-interacting protein 1, mitochondrial [Trichechus manatus latirostris]|uniref:M-AAA protease-interacting protein 1, mitochondrial n=1 Tax=Trichechus manatus latirostris TaxID=127582 RepID=A0A2Y9FXG2_TRIMA|nr:m-AAA protease-interacting protein 1, mitochondrial [Trichechus manatus latirostris]